MDNDNHDDDIADVEEVEITFDDEVADLAACKDNILDFEKRRKELHEKTGVRLGKIDEAVGKLTGGDGRGPSQADVLISIGTACALFHSPDGTAYAENEPFEIGADDVTLFGQWTAIDYTVTYNSGSDETTGTPPVDDIPYHIGDQVTVHRSNFVEVFPEQRAVLF